MVLGALPAWPRLWRKSSPGLQQPGLAGEINCCTPSSGSLEWNCDYPGLLPESLLNRFETLCGPKEMSELPRRIASQLRRFFGNRRRARRASAQLTFTVGLDSTRASSNGSRKLPSLDGHTLDISSTGMALVVPAIRIGEHYLTGDDRRLRVKLELPDGPVEMWMVPVRYESLEEDEIESGYVIGERITQMSEVHRARFEEYIAQLHGRQPAHERIPQSKRSQPNASGT